MKKLFLVALVVVSFTAFAQEGIGKPDKEAMGKLTPEQRTEKHLKKLTADLNLNANQQEQVKQILTEQGIKREAFKAKREEYKANNLKPTPEEREALKSKMQEEKNAMDSKMKAILSPEQFEKWISIQEKKKEKMKARMEEKKEERN